METPLYFRNGGYKLFGVLHGPESTSAPLLNQKLGVVFCHPFAEEKMIAHRSMVSLARRMAELGISCLRFDEMGHGDSEGSFEHATIETRMSDIRCAAEYLRKNTTADRIGILGLRLGGTLAALAYNDGEKIDFLIAIAPIIDGRAYMEQCLRSNLTTQMTTFGKITTDRKQLVDKLEAGHFVNIDGYLIGRELYHQMNGIRLADNAPAGPDQILFIQIVRNQDQSFDKGLKHVSDQWGLKGKNVVLEKAVEDLFWKDSKVYNPEKADLQRVIAAWCDRMLVP